MRDIHQDLESICDVALHYAEEHNCNYTVILSNPGIGSTYDFVSDSYFGKERNCDVLMETDWVLNRFVEIDCGGLSDSEIMKKAFSSPDRFIPRETYKISNVHDIGYNREYIEPMDEETRKVLLEASRRIKR